MPIGVWIIDDTPSHHTAAAHVVAQLSTFALETFDDGASAVAEFTLRAASAPQTLPRIILMDFFMGDMRGDEATRLIRAIDPRGFPPIIVGYSSVASGSAAIVAAGGDVVVRKRIADDGSNPALREYLETFLRIAGS
ncbi:MAG: response regulator [Planctomycetota bacterium]